MKIDITENVEVEQPVSIITITPKAVAKAIWFMGSSEQAEVLNELAEIRSNNYANFDMQMCHVSNSSLTPAVKNLVSDFLDFLTPE